MPKLFGTSGQSRGGNVDTSGAGRPAAGWQAEAPAPRIWQMLLEDSSDHSNEFIATGQEILATMQLALGQWGFIPRPLPVRGNLVMGVKLRPLWFDPKVRCGRWRRKSRMQDSGLWPETVKRRRTGGACFGPAGRAAPLVSGGRPEWRRRLFRQSCKPR